MFKCCRPHDEFCITLNILLDNLYVIVKCKGLSVSATITFINNIWNITWSWTYGSKTCSKSSWYTFEVHINTFSAPENFIWPHKDGFICLQNLTFTILNFLLPNSSTWSFSSLFIDKHFFCLLTQIESLQNDAGKMTISLAAALICSVNLSLL